MLTKWRGQLKELCDKYPTLVFFSVPKALLLYEFIHSDSPDTEKILEEISCLVLKDKIHDVKVQFLYIVTIHSPILIIIDCPQTTIENRIRCQFLTLLPWPRGNGYAKYKSIN